MRVKCLAQEHNTMSPARARARSACSEVERTNHKATAPPQWISVSLQNCQTVLRYHLTLTLANRVLKKEDGFRLKNRLTVNFRV